MKKIYDFETFNELYQWVMSAKKEFEFPICFRLIDKPSRSIKQNSLYWKWLGEIERQTAVDKDIWHTEFKHKYAVPIFRGDDPEYNEMILSILAVKRAGLNQEFETIRNQVIELTSTTDFSTVQFDHYLKNIWFHAVAAGWMLTHPDDQGLDDLIKR